MQHTLIAIQKNGQQVVLGQDLQEHSVNSMVRTASMSGAMSHVRSEAKYRSFIAIGTNEGSTMLIRFNSMGDVTSRSAGIT